jgi:hypothetical protein
MGGNVLDSRIRLAKNSKKFERTLFSYSIACFLCFLTVIKAKAALNKIGVTMMATVEVN